jgi:regulatory protein
MAERSLPKARDYALRLFKIRMRSEKEVRDKLKLKKYEADVIDKTVEFLKKAYLLDDALFARLWVASRLKKPMGLRRLEFELKLKGVPREDIDEALANAQKDYDEGSVLQGLIQAKMKKMKTLAPDKKKARLYAWLLRRGYSSDAIRDAMQIE